jgi:competence protein ComEA
MARQRWLVPLLAASGGLALGIGLVALAVVFPGGLLGAGSAAQPEEPFDASLSAAFSASLDAGAVDPGTLARADLVVDVGGAVVRPGLHRLAPGDRVGDAIEAAGGYAPRVDLVRATESLNLAQPLEDGVKILVPELGSETRRDGGQGDSRVDLNRADQSELESLPGIGPVTAGKIIDTRSSAPFASTRELRSRGVVGEAVFDDIKDLVRVSN